MKRRQRTLLVLFLLAAAVTIAGPARAQGEATDEAAGAQLRIRFPPGVVAEVSVETGDHIITLLLPRGSQFPLDFAAASNGLVRRGQVTPMGDGQLKLDLELDQGELDRIDYRPDGVVLEIGRRTVALTEVASKNNYALGPDDIIQLTVHNQKELNAELTVTREGTIFAPLLGEIRVEGMTPRQVAILLTERLGRSYLVNPQVDVDVEEFRSQWVMVTGQVQRLGRIMLHGGTRLKEVLSEAGGFTEDAGEAITISRKTQGSEEYEYEVERIDRALFERGEIDPMLYHGDIVDVARSHYAYIDGEVRKPSRIPIERGLTLMRAISMVGGLTEWANRKQVRILYPGEGGESRVETYNLKRIQEGKDPDPELHGGETIIIERRYF